METKNTIYFNHTRSWYSTGTISPKVMLRSRIILVNPEPEHDAAPASVKKDVLT
jgi:hypothetical protein